MRRKFMLQNRNACRPVAFEENILLMYLTFMNSQDEKKNDVGISNEFSREFFKEKITSV